jgi:hypothetical protein
MATEKHGEPRIPTADEEKRFWSLLEAAWAQLDTTVNQTRLSMARLTADADKDAGLSVIDGATDAFLDALGGLCAEMSSEELTDLDRVVERRLYEIDRAEIQAVTDGSDDGFLYARGLIVALGHEYYAAVDADPNVAVLDGELEAMCYFFAHLHGEKFGSWTKTGSGISRESCSNAAGWRS